MRLIVCADRFLQPPVAIVFRESAIGVIRIGIRQQL